jgi:hypothetical protein
MNPATIGDLADIIQRNVEAAIVLASSGAVVMLVVGGFQYLLAGGDKEATQKAGKTITFAIAGILVVICSWMIIKLLGSFLGLDLSSFVFKVCLPGFTGSDCHRGP